MNTAIALVTTIHPAFWWILVIATWLLIGRLLRPYWEQKKHNPKATTSAKLTTAVVVSYALMFASFLMATNAMFARLCGEV